MREGGLREGERKKEKDNCHFIHMVHTGKDKTKRLFADFILG